LRRFVILLMSCFVAGPLSAQQVQLTDDGIKTAVSGSVLELDTPLGTTVSIRFNRDGLMSGDAKELASLLGAATDRGRWWVASNRLCYKWFRWFDAETRCLVVSREAKRIFWQRDDGENGTATIVEEGQTLAKPMLAIPVATHVAEVKKKEPDRKLPHPANRHELKEAVASAPLANRSNERGGAQPEQVSLSTQLATKASIDLPPLTKPRSMPINVPVPRLAVRPKTHLAKKVLASSARPAPAVKSTSFKVAGVEPYDVLNIRNGPSQDHDLVGEISPAAGGIVITGRCVEDWCPIRHRNVSGWVNRYYLAEEISH